MNLKPCPRCGKPTKIQAQFPIGSMIQLVLQCGHLNLITKEEYGTISNNGKSLDSVLGISGCEVKDNGTPNLNSICHNLDNILLHSRQVKTVHNSNVASCGFGRAIMEYNEVPEPTFKELYQDLDEWVMDGGRVKGVNEPEIPEYIHPSFYSYNGKKCAYSFQRSGIQFAERTQLNCLIGDAMGLGKTIQALISLKRNKQVAFPALIIVKGATLFQWHNEFSEWISPELGDCIPVTTRNHLIPGFNCYIVSMDMLSKTDFVDKLLTLNLKTVVIDEVQNFKDSDAKRTKGLTRLIKLGNIQFKIALSGTAIKNRLGEYFTILNILAPNYFRGKGDFNREWLIPNEKGYLTRLNPLKLDQFKTLLGNWIIRREKHEVLTNLPDLTRDYQIIEIDDPNIRKSYNHTLDLFDNWLKNNVDEADSTQLLGWLAKLRAITGQAKCKNALEWTRDFLESSDESLAIGIQHHSVRDTLYIICEQFGFNPLKLSGEDNIYKKNDIVRRFTSGDNRLLIINSIAGGVGLNLQTCANALVLERQWNSADEEQFEARFHRDGQKKAVTITYMIAKNTIDEFFHDMVMRKRNILHEAGIGSGFDLDNDITSLKEFAAKVVNSKI